MDDPTALVDSLTESVLDPDLLEIMLIQTGSAGGSATLTTDWGRQVRRLRLPGQGPAAAKRLGLRSARHEFVTFLRSDDRIGAGALSLASGLPRSDEIVALRAGSHNLNLEMAQTQRSAGDTSEALPGPGRSPVLTFASLGSVRWVVPTWLALTATPSIPLGRWWELVLVATIQTRSRAPVRWATAAADGPPDVMSPPEPQIDTWDEVEPLLGAIAALEDASTEDPSCAVTVRPVVRRLAALLRPLLDEQPTLRVPLMDAILAARIRDFPFSELSRGLATDLAIAYSFPPSRDTSAVVAAKRLRERGRVTDVISCDLQRGDDPGTSMIAGGLIDRHVQVRGPASYGQWPDVEAFIRAGLTTVDTWVEEGREYSCLYSRSMWPASHLLAALLKQRVPTLNWSAEFSDPMQSTITGRRRHDSIEATSPIISELTRSLRERGFPRPTSDNLWEWVEHVSYALADEVIFTNINQRDFMLAATQHKQLRDRARRLSSIRPHPQPSDSFYTYAEPPYPLDPGLAHLAYFGAFYPNRGIGVVLAAIADSPRAVQESLHLHVFSNDPGGVRAQARAAGVGHCVTSRPYVNYFDFLALTRLVDLLVVNDTQTVKSHALNPYLPSKISDYLGSETDIWAIYEPGSPISSIRVRYRSALGDPGAACEVLRQATAGKRIGSEP